MKPVGRCTNLMSCGGQAGGRGQTVGDAVNGAEATQCHIASAPTAQLAIIAATCLHDRRGRWDSGLFDESGT